MRDFKVIANQPTTTDGNVYGIQRMLLICKPHDDVQRTYNISKQSQNFEISFLFWTIRQNKKKMEFIIKF